MKKLVLATGNKGKVAELSAILADKQIHVLPQSEFNVPDVEETGTTFVENAIIKARHAAKITGLPAIADDSGLEIDALQGQPGVFSARFAGDNASDENNINKVLTLMADIPLENRSARFHCVLVYMKHADDPTPIICHGQWQGKIATSKSGEQGFGYDPIFLPEETNGSAAQLSKEEKNKFSHRGKALAQLVQLI